MGERDSKCRAQTLEPAWALEEQQEDYWLEKNGGGMEQVGSGRWARPHHADRVHHMPPQVFLFSLPFLRNRTPDV